MTDQLSWLDHHTTGASLPERPPLTVVGLFAGVGGIELGLHRVGHQTVEFCENDPAARAVLAYHFGGIPTFEDVRRYPEIPKSADLVTAGFPCQDVSQAGRTLGLEGTRSSLVGEVFRLLRGRSAPEWLLLENVSFMLQLAHGRVLDVIISNLEMLGYKWAYRVVDTRAFGIPQRRRRVFILASHVHDPRTVLLVDNEPEPPEPFESRGAACGFYWTEGSRGLGWAVDAVPTLKGGSTVGIPSPPGIWHPTAGIIRPGIHDAERLQGFPVAWTAPAEQVVRGSLRWKLVGNAVTVDVAEWIGHRLRYPVEYHAIADARIGRTSKWPIAAYNVGSGRFAAPVTSWPFSMAGEPLAEFINLEEASPLSSRATSGFLNRFRNSSLSKPDGFLQALERHLREARSAA